MAAQQAPPKNPPRKIADDLEHVHDKPLRWTPVQRAAWDQNDRDVDVYVRAYFLSVTPIFLRRKKRDGRRG